MIRYLKNIIHFSLKSDRVTIIRMSFWRKILVLFHCFVLCLCLFIENTMARTAPVRQIISLPASFDFGPVSAPTKNGYTPVRQNSLYDNKTGYGLLDAAEKSFFESKHKILDSVTADGICSADSITFAVRVPPASYYIELLFGGGLSSRLFTKIRFNDLCIVDTLRTLYVSSERDEPPRSWQSLYHITTEDSLLTISIRAFNQPTDLAGIRIFGNDPGPMHLQDGKLSAELNNVPNAELITRLLNAGKPQEVHRLIDAISDSSFGFEKALLLLAQAGRLEIDEPRPLIENAVHLLEKEVQKTNDAESAALNLHLAKLYLQADRYYKMAGWDWAKKSSGEGIFMRLELAARALEEMTHVKNHPLYHRALWYLGKMAFWDWVEEHGSWQKQKADQCFQILQPFYPEHRLLKMYLGERLRSPEITAPKEGDGPAWAVAENRALKGLLSVIHYWVDERQAENGEMGGKYDDDVEMLRWWPVARLAANDSTTLRGLRRLVDGIWNSDWIKAGFSAKVRDVEHASEPVADTQPLMIGLDYGNPIYVERCMASARLMRDLWTGVNKKGHRHFKTSWYSSKKLDERPPRNCDVPMNARTVKAVRWLAWYNHHPEAIRLIREWSDAWLEDCLRTDRGKPYGVVPPSVRYDDDAISGYGPSWYDSDMFWTYYNFRGGSRMMQQFLATFELTGDEKYLQPIEIAIKIAQKYSSEEIKAALKGSEAWVAGILQKSKGFARVLEEWRLLTGDSRYDDVLEKYASDYMKFRLTGDKEWLVRGSRHIIDATYYNRELITTEAYFTDRVDIGDIHHGQDWAGSHLESMYLGSSLLQGFFPFYRVNWEGLGSDFSAVVLHADQKHIKIAAYSFNDQALHAAISFWWLAPGRYEFVQGADLNGDNVIDGVDVRDQFDISFRSGSHKVTLPPHCNQIIRVDQVEAFTQSSACQMPDLAMSKNEVSGKADPSNQKFVITAPVHNIGIADAHYVIVELKDKKSGRVLARQTIKKIRAPLDLMPKMHLVEFVLSPKLIKDKKLEVMVRTKENIAEFTMGNNAVVLDGF